MRRLLLVLPLAAIIALIIWWVGKPEPVPVTLAQVTRGTVEASVFSRRAGSVEACQRTRLSPISAGRISYLGVKKGDRVKKGQVLLKLSNAEQQAQSRLAQTQLESARKHADTVCSLAENAENEADRLMRLRTNGVVSEENEQKARTEAQARRAACTSTRAEAEQAQTRVKATRAERGRTILVAPFAGTVADIVGELGTYTIPARPGTAPTPAIDLIDDSCMYISAPMDEVDAPRIRAGQPARATLHALPGKILPAHVKRVAPYVVAAEKQERTVNVEATLDDRPEPGELLVGYSADLEVILDTRQNVLRVPTSALRGNTVLLYQKETGTLEARTVKPGISNREYTEIMQGLSLGDEVVTSLEREGVKSGAKAVPQRAAPAK